jgi:hypothetical protein
MIAIPELLRAGLCITSPYQDLASTRCRVSRSPALVLPPLLLVISFIISKLFLTLFFVLKIPAEFCYIYLSKS